MLKDISEYTNDELASLLDEFDVPSTALVERSRTATAAAVSPAPGVPSFAFGSLLPPPPPPSPRVCSGFGAEETMTAGVIDAGEYLYPMLSYSSYPPPMSSSSSTSSSSWSPPWANSELARASLLPTPPQFNPALSRSYSPIDGTFLATQTVEFERDDCGGRREIDLGDASARSSIDNGSPGGSDRNESEDDGDYMDEKRAPRGAVRGRGRGRGRGGSASGRGAGKKGRVAQGEEAGGAGDGRDAKGGKKRTRTGCIGCRLKRVKCGEEHPSCKRCIVADRECIWPDEGQVISRKKGFEPYQLTQAQQEKRERERSATAASPKARSRKNAGREGKQGSGSDRSERGVGAPSVSPSVDRGNEGMGASFFQTMSPKEGAGPASLCALDSSPLSHDISLSPDVPLATLHSQTPSLGAAGRSLSTPNAFQPTTYSLNQAVSFLSNVNFNDPPSRSMKPFSTSASSFHTNPSFPPTLYVQPSNASSSFAFDSTSSFEFPLSSATSLDPPSSSYATLDLLSSDASLSSLTIYYPFHQDRSLIQHLLAHSQPLISAISTDPFPSLLSSLLASSLSPSPQSDTLRLILLALAATHRAFLLARQATEIGSEVARALEVAVVLRGRLRVMLEGCERNGQGLEGVMGRKGSPIGLESSAMIGALDVMLGGHAWEDGLRVAKKFVQERGGPTAILATTATEEARHNVDSGAASACTRTKLMLEIIAFHDVVGSLVTGRETTLIFEGTWWFALASSACSNHFGVSRSTIALFARSVNLVAQPEEGSQVQSDKLGAEVAMLTRDVEREIASMNMADGSVKERIRHGDLSYLHATLILLYRNTTTTFNTSATNASSPSSSSATSSFPLPRSSPKVQRASLSILTSIEACISLSSTSSQPRHLLWPLILAATQVDAPAMPWVKTILAGLRSGYRDPASFKGKAGENVGGGGAGGGGVCFSVDSGEKIIREVWANLDAGHESFTWRDAVEKLDMKVLLT